MYKSNIQSQEKTIMEAHEKYMLDKRSLEHGIQMRDEQISSLTAEKDSLMAEKDSLTAENDSLTAENSSLITELSLMSAKNSSLNSENAKLLALLKESGFSEEQIASRLAE